MPLIDKVAYKHTLKEQAIDVASQLCITKDNIAVKVARSEVNNTMIIPSNLSVVSGIIAIATKVLEQTKKS